MESKGITIRMPDALRQQIRVAAANRDESMNTWMVQKLRAAAARDSLRDLDDVYRAMKNKDIAAMDPQHPEQWSAELPTFGGPEPEDTMGVWSWDESRLIVGEGDNLEIVTREEWE